ncbi:hypothetical protein GWC77_15220 [Paraburkholderia sp. NMBU_R16]|uniref:plasmid mobilization protein n=1 Tax=Paraburkholderia sp. NMBU_R16 TaxID=2698676 RepID=UPI0015676CFF|nr:hypothetical protein [Paraburkholderia sp. NMBU_R16]NRO97275.1 hypothetical protein [Paraburkholderia sp. NMBU_R16]
MNQSSERIAVFVTPAQKRALATKAQSLGISISELVRRAVLAFEETADDVRAARIVDSWSAPSAPDSLNETLRRIADAAPARESATQHRISPCEPSADTPAASAAMGAGGEPDEAAAVPLGPLPVAAAVAQALACQPVEEARTEDSEPPPALDLETVTRLTSRWSETSADDPADSPSRRTRKRFTPRPA